MGWDPVQQHRRLLQESTMVVFRHIPRQLSHIPYQDHIYKIEGKNVKHQGKHPDNCGYFFMEFPTSINSTDHFRFKGCSVVFFNFVHILIKYSVSK